MELSKERPTQLTEIHVNQADFEDLFIASTLSWCNQVEVDINHFLKALQVLMGKRFVMTNNELGLSLVRTLHAWLQYILIFLDPILARAFVWELEEYQKIDSYLDWDNQDDYVSFRKDAFAQAVRNGEFNQTVFQHRFDLAGIIEDCRQGTMQDTSFLSFLREGLLDCDYRRANLEPYADSVLSDINIGHWELFEAPKENAVPVVPSSDQVWTARL